MKTKKIISLVAVLSILLFVVGYVMTDSYSFGLCSYSEVDDVVTKDVSCNQSFIRVGDPVMYGFGALAVVFLALMVFPQSFNAWKKFAIWFIPIAAILFIIWPEPKGGIGVVPSVIGPGPEQMFQWISAFYILVSFGIIAVKQFRK